MSRLQGAAFAALLVATVAAFFVVQHLKIQDPLIQGQPAPVPSAFDPVNGVSGPGEPRSCYSHPLTGPRKPIDYRQVFTTFYLQHKPDHVAVYIVDTAGNIVDTLAQNYNFKKIDVRNPPSAFVWNGKDQNTGTLAPAGTYYYRVVFLGQDRTIPINDPITLTTTPPRPRVTAVSPPVISDTSAKVTYTGTTGLRGFVDVIRTDLPGGPRTVFSFKIRRKGDSAVWNGQIHGKPAPAGTYLMGLQVFDAACHVGTFPAEDPPVPGTTPHAGVTVRYLAAEVPNVAVAAGQSATVLVDSRQHAYTWKLFRPGFTRVLAQGASHSFALSVPLPATGPALYALSITYPGQHTLVPLVASAPGDAAPRPILVVLPALTWQGENPVDDNHDGLPNTLSNGGPIKLARVLADGLPADFADESALLAELDRAGFHYDLTTDLGLLTDPSLLAHHRGVVLAGSERWIPSPLAGALHSFVESGGHVLSLGTDSLSRTVQITPGGEAVHPSAPHATDIFGARPGQIVEHNRNLVLPFSDPLGLFTTGSRALGGITTFQAIQPPAGTAATTAGISALLPAIVGFKLGAGAVIEVGLDDFGASLAKDADFRALLARAWRLLGS